MKLYAIDIETDTTIDGLDPTIAEVVTRARKKLTTWRGRVHGFPIGPQDSSRRCVGRRSLLVEQPMQASNPERKTIWHSLHEPVHLANRSGRKTGPESLFTNSVDHGLA